MADTALRLLADGQTEKVRIGDITEDNRHDNYICDGMDTAGRLCGAAVYPRISGIRPCFCVGIQDSRHICGCPNDESVAATIRRHLDVTGRTTKIGDLMASFAKTERQATELRRSIREKGAADGDVAESKAKTDDERRVRREARNPKNMRELAALLAKSDLDDIYAGIPIRKLIVDHRNVSQYRRDGLYDGQMAIILCKRLGPKSLARLVPERLSGDVIVGDAYAYEDRATPLVLVIDGSTGAYEKIFYAKKESIIAIFAKWHRHPMYKNAYTCEQINVGQVFVAQSSFFEQ